MRNFTHIFAGATLSLSAFLIVLASPVFGSHRPDATRFPNEGNLTYNGSSSAQAYFYWHRVGGWRGQNVRPGIEFDIALENATFFDSCTSWSDLPYKNYSDCGTAGASEPGGGKNFGIGTYDAKSIQNYRWYRGQWSFSGGSGYSSFARLTWQEVDHNLCPFDYPWCMAGIPGTGNAGVLRSGTFVRGQSFYQRYYY